MSIYVLTSREGRSDKPTGIGTTDVRVADNWTGQTRGNDYYELKIDDYSSLEFPLSGPQFVAENQITVVSNYNPPPLPSFKEPRTAEDCVHNIRAGIKYQREAIAALRASILGCP